MTAIKNTPTNLALFERTLCELHPQHCTLNDKSVLPSEQFAKFLREQLPSLKLETDELRPMPAQALSMMHSPRIQAGRFFDGPEASAQIKPAKEITSALQTVVMPGVHTASRHSVRRFMSFVVSDIESTSEPVVLCVLLPEAHRSVS